MATIKNKSTAKKTDSASKKTVKQRIVKSERKTNKTIKPKIIFSFVLIGLLVISGAIVFLGWIIPCGFLNMGMNISGVNYYHSRNLMFNDIMKTKHKITTAGNFQGDYTGELADDGYPLEFTSNNPYFDPATPIILINNIYEGDYVFLYEGEGEISFEEGIEVISEMPNKIYLTLTEAKRTADKDPHRRVVIRSSIRGNHVRNMRMIPIEFESKEDKMPLFNKDFLNGLRGMKVLRFMDAQSTNGSTQQHWTDRPVVTDWAYDVQGIPLEILIELANTLKINPWLCVPHKASDDYIQKMAKLIKERLNKNLKCYIEYSNEVWHTGFAQGGWINQAADAVDSYIKNDLAQLRSKYYGTDNRHLKNAYFMARTFRIFKSEFSDKERSRLVTVATYYYWEYPREMIEYLIEQDLCPDTLAGVGYFNFNESHHNKWMQNPSAVTSIDIINAVYETWAEYEEDIKYFAGFAKQFNIPYIVYEGGQHMQPWKQCDWPYNQAVWDAQIHPKMYDLYIKNFKLHANLGCELFVNFSYVSARESQFGSWGVLENIRDATSKNLKAVAPKYKAIIDANKRRGLFR